MNCKPLIVMLALLLPQCLGAQTDSARAHNYLNEAVTQMGGEAALRTLKTVRFEAVGHRNMLEESERPEGPYIVEYDRITQLRDLEHGRWKQTMAMKIGPQPEFTATTVVADGAAKMGFDTQFSPGSNDHLQRAAENLELGPERVLFTALAASDLRAEADTVLQSVPHHVVGFTWKKLPVRIFLNANTALPTAVEWTAAYPSEMFWGAWGDVTNRLYYSFWWLCPGGIHYPLQWDWMGNGLPDHVMTITDIAVNVDFPADAFLISADDKSAFEKRRNLTLDDRPLGNPNRPAVEVAKDIVHIPGSWNVTLVRQSDGIVIVEAPISSGYSVKVLAEAEKRWPGIPVKAVLSTSDSWPHIAGVREYVARGIPVYAPDLNLPILSRLVYGAAKGAPGRVGHTSREARLPRSLGQDRAGHGSESPRDLSPARRDFGAPDDGLFPGAQVAVWQRPVPEG